MFDIGSIIGLQRQLVIDLSGSRTNDRAISIINTIDASLSQIETAVQNANASVGPVLTQQSAIKDILDREEQRLKDREEAISSADYQQKRLVELTGNATLQKQATNKMYLIIVIALLLFVAVKLIAGFVPVIIADILTIIIIAGAIVLVVYIQYDISRRNNMNINEIDLGEPAKMVAKTETDSSKINLADLRIGGCVGQGCCAPGTTYNEKHSICVPNASNGNAYFIDTKTIESTATRCTSGNTYSAIELGCVASEGFSTMINATVKPFEPSEVVDYSKY
jgi:hypothetical protein